MEWTELDVRRALGDKLIGSQQMQKIVCRTLLLLPHPTLEHVCKVVWFISSPDDSWAFTFKGSEIKERYLIFLSDELLNESEEQIRYTTLHEVGHVVLNHRNSIGYHQTDEEIQHQEKEADVFARGIIGKDNV